MSRQKSKRNNGKQYPVDQSPLYKIGNRRKFAALLGPRLKDLNALLSRSDNYHVGRVPKKDGTFRQVEVPTGLLEILHRRFFVLLARIQTPAYLHSGIRSRSYITNALQHVGDHSLAKLDIKKFFPSTSSQQIRRGFRNTFRCSPDVAYLIARLCSCDGHVPTGSSISSLVAYYAHKTLFDTIHRVASSLTG